MKPQRKSQRTSRKKPMLMACAAVLAVAAVAAAVFFFVMRDGYDRTLAETFFAVRPNTIFVFEDTDPSRSTRMFFEHIDDENGVAQRIVRTQGCAQYIEKVVYSQNMMQNVFISSHLSRGNHLALDTRLQDTINVLSGPLAEGRSWRVHAYTGPHAPTANFTVQSMNTRVTVPFGTFRALQIRAINLTPGSILTRYYAPGIGLIKIVDEVLNAAGELRRFEKVLVDIIENTGWQEPLTIFFPNESGQIEYVETYTTIYTGDDYITNVFAAATAYWERAFGFSVDFAWFENVSTLTLGTLDPVTGVDTRVVRPLFRFNEDFLAAMNAVYDAETEEQILFSVAATLASAFPFATHRTGLNFNAGMAFIAIGDSLFVSDRLTPEWPIAVTLGDPYAPLPTLRPPRFSQRMHDLFYEYGF